MLTADEFTRAVQEEETSIGRDAAGPVTDEDAGSWVPVVAFEARFGRRALATARGRRQRAVDGRSSF